MTTYDDYYFNVKVGRCGSVVFVNDVIDRGYLVCVFVFRIKKKEKDTFYINFYSIIFLQSFYFLFILYIYIFYFSSLQLNIYNGCV